MAERPHLILASASPRRAAVLGMLGLEFEVRPARIPEEPSEGERPTTYVTRLAREKAEAVAGEAEGAFVVGADTVVLLDRAIMEKPADAEEARAMLRVLAGRSHTVLTAVALRTPGAEVRGTLERAEVRFRDVPAEEIDAYVATGEPLDKAGGYGIQGFGAALVEGIRGDYYTVVGLPVVPLLGLFRAAGWRYRFGSGLERL